jgi:hypothetical protein
MALQGTFGSGGEVVFNLRIDTSGAESEVNSLFDKFAKLEQIALRYLVIARRMGLPEDVERALSIISQLIVTIRQLQLTLSLLEGSMGPVGWALLGAGAIGTALTAGSVAMDVMGEVY